ncbi:MAG: aminoglycoside phosphotransferase family protein [Pseudohongiellaceae bacterium]
MQAPQQGPGHETNMLRRQALEAWFTAQCQSLGLGTPADGIAPVSGDASFRRYFRGVTTQGQWILVDAPPDKEDSRPFLAVQALLQQGAVQVPQVFAADLQQGFMCLQDFGSDLLWPALDLARQRGDLAAAGALYREALAELLKIQHCPAHALPPYDTALLRREVLLFRDWLCAGILGMTLGAEDQRLLEALFDLLVQSALEQPRVFVHRDYHSRNLMLLPSGIGVIDFQDAVQGPFSYDLVSLLKDCYIAWPDASVQAWALDYLARASDARLVPQLDERAFLRSFDLMGVQRHLKAAGIFCRLWLRDGKPGYLGDIPRTLGYIMQLSARDGIIGEFRDWLDVKVLAQLQEACSKALQQPRPGQSA